MILKRLSGSSIFRIKLILLANNERQLSFVSPVKSLRKCNWLSPLPHEGHNSKL